MSEPNKPRSLKLATQDVPLEHPDGTLHHYQLREIGGKARDSFTSLVASRMTFSPDGQPQGIRNPAGLQLALLKDSLFDEAGLPVPSTVLEGWPGSLVNDLYKEAERLSRLTPETKAAVGNG